MRPAHTFSALRPRWALACALACAPSWTLSVTAPGSKPPQPAEFAWRATLEVPAGSSGARVTLPPELLRRLQSSDARDLRVFNGAGQPVPFGLLQGAASAPPEQRTRSYPAHPLFSAAPGAPPAAGAVKVQVGSGTNTGSVWVQLDGSRSDTAAHRPLKAAIFDLRKEALPLTALHLEAAVPPNVPVQVTAASSKDLASWTPLALQGRLYRFENADAPQNLTLALASPANLEGRYLRLEWEGQEGVRISALSASIARPAVAERKVWPLPPPTVAGPAALEWALDFATPIAALKLASQQPHSLLPVRILGRNEAAQPWRQLARTVVYRLQEPSGSEASNPAVVLDGSSVRWLRVEATHGMQIAAGALSAQAEFAPIDLIFVASGAPPFELAGGRADTAATNLASELLGNSLGERLREWPVARIGAVREQAPRGKRAIEGLWAGAPPTRTLTLWVVLLGGVLLLGLVALALLRQLRSPASPPP